jgi:hypothetical protein
MQNTKSLVQIVYIGLVTDLDSNLPEHQTFRPDTNMSHMTKMIATLSQNSAVEGSGFGVQSLGFRVQGSGFRV